MCPRCEGMGTANDIDLTQLYDETQVARRGRDHGPRLHRRRLVDPDVRRVRLLRPDKPIRDYTEDRAATTSCTSEPVKVKINGINLTYEGLVPRIQKSMLSKDVDALQPHIRAFVERAVTFSACPDCGGTRLNEARALLEDRRRQHRRRVRDADQRPRRVGPRARRADRSRRCWPRSARASIRSSRWAWATSASTARRARCRAARPSARG